MKKIPNKRLKETFGSVVLVNPNNFGNYVQGAFQREHLGLGYLAAELMESGFNSQIIDSRILAQTPKQAVDDILKRNPSILGFSIIAKSAAKWCQQVAIQVKAKKPDIHITMGNYFPSLQPERALASVPSADSIILFEGDYSFPELASCLAQSKQWKKIKGLIYRDSGRVKCNPVGKVVANLDELPFPIHTAGQYGLNEFAIEGSRGCYLRCIFCSIGTFFGHCQRQERWRARSAKSLVTEIKNCLNAFPKINRFRFVDPDFCGASSPQHLIRLNQIIQEFKRVGRKFEFIIDTRSTVVNTIPKSVWKRLKDVGLSEVYLGIESATKRIKRKLGKGSFFTDDLKAFRVLEKLRIRVRYGFMMITPWSTEEDIIANAKAIKNLGFPRIDKYFQEMFVVPGTKAVELTRQVSKLWFDQNGEGEYYTYELPTTLHNLRSISRALTTNSLTFLKKYQNLHESIRRCFEDQRENVEIYKNSFNNLSYHFFMSVFEIAKKFGKKMTNTEVKDAVNNVTRVYKKKVNSLEKDFCSRKGGKNDDIKL